MHILIEIKSWRTILSGFKKYIKVISAVFGNLGRCLWLQSFLTLQKYDLSIIITSFCSK